MAFGGKGCCVERGQGQCWKRVIFNAETSVAIDIQSIVVFNAEARRGVLDDRRRYPFPSPQYQPTVAPSCQITVIYRSRDVVMQSRLAAHTTYVAG